MTVFKASAKSEPKKIAGAIAGAIREESRIEITAVGAGAINQAVKGIAIANGFVAPEGINLVCVPAFSDVTLDGEEKTGIKFIIKKM